MTNYNELRKGQEFFANGYKKGYEDAKKEFESNITQAINEELTALSNKIASDKLLALSILLGAVRFNILRKLEERSKE